MLRVGLIRLEFDRIHKFNFQSKPNMKVSTHSSCETSLTCHIGSHSVICHLAEATFPPYIKPGTHFSDPGGMQG